MVGVNILDASYISSPGSWGTSTLHLPLFFPMLSYDFPTCSYDFLIMSSPIVFHSFHSLPPFLETLQFSNWAGRPSHVLSRHPRPHWSRRPHLVGARRHLWWWCPGRRWARDWCPGSWVMGHGSVTAVVWGWGGWGWEETVRRMRLSPAPFMGQYSSIWFNMVQ